MTARRRRLEADSQGRYRPRVGWYDDGHGQPTQPRFNLGTDKREAEARYARILQLYDDDCRTHGPEQWTIRGLEYARLVAAGKTTIEYRPHRADDDYDDAVVLNEYAAKIELDRDRFPSLNIQPSDPDEYRESVLRSGRYVSSRLRELEDELRGLYALAGKDAVPDQLVAGTFHEALDAYAEAVRRDGQRLDGGVLKPYQRLRLARVGRFKREHPDLPLHRLTYDGCAGLVAYWRNRPPTLKGTRSSRDNARHHVHELFRFLRWLDATDLFRWQMPRGLAAVGRKVDKLDGEKKLSAVTKATYSPEQLAVLNRHATPLERAALYLGLNCAMGAAELGRLTADDFAVRQRHPHADRLRFESGAGDTFLRYFRPKTEVFGEWLVWPEVVGMAEWLIRRAAAAGTNVLFVRETGRPLFDESSSNAQMGFANLWDRLQARVRRSDPGFPRLPFGTLRDTLPEVLRRDYSDELASMVLTHGRPAKADTLLECYSNKPFGRFHTALREIHRQYGPVFAAVDDPLREVKQYLPAAVRDRIRCMIADGKGTTETARACGVSRMTVIRERKAAATVAAVLNNDQPLPSGDCLDQPDRSNDEPAISTA